MQTKLQYLLGCVAEEAGEVTQRAIKAQRFGLFERQPEQISTNADRLVHEYLDLVTMMQILTTELEITHPGFNVILDSTNSSNWIRMKKERFDKYYEYSKSLGEVE